MTRVNRSSLSIRPIFRTLGVASSAVIIIALCSHAMAQTVSNSEETRWGLGLAAGVLQRAYVGTSNKNRATPLSYVENSWLRVAGPMADLKLATIVDHYGTISFAARLKYDSLAYEANDSPQLAGMDERKMSFWAGGSMSWSTSMARASLDLLRDVSGNSKGQQLLLQLDRRFDLGALSFTPRIQAQWLDKKYVDYYYGV